jgi:hypothetical protein
MRPIDLTGAHGTWQMLANMYRPTDGEALQAECRRLRDSGLTAHDIASVMRLGLGAVLQALRDGGQVAA